MVNFINTVDIVGDEALTNSIIDRSIVELADNKIKTVGGYAFAYCSALTTVDFPAATSITSTAFYKCSSLTSVTLPVVTSINDNAFRDCSSLTSIDLPLVASIGSYAFMNCFSLTTLILRSETMCTLSSTGAFTNTPIASGTGYIYVHPVLVDAYKAATNWSTYANQILPFGTYVENIFDNVSEFNSVLSKTVQYYTQDTAATITVTSNNTSVATVSNIAYSDGNLTFDINTLSTEGDATITISLIASDGNYENSFNITVYETLPTPTYSVEAINGSSYGFELNEDGYYESSNNGVNSSASVCKVVFNTQGVYHLYLDCINYAEPNYDFGILSTVDNTLSTTSTADSANVFKSFKGSSKSTVQTVDYGIVEAGEHFIYVKYRKDSSSHNNNDSLQFKVRFE